MLLIPDCSDRTARKIDKHVLSVPLTLMMGRRYFVLLGWRRWQTHLTKDQGPKKGVRVRVSLRALSNVIKERKEHYVRD